jgi:restriction endonuclease Mrr
MPIPDFQSIMLPLLDFLRDQKEHSSKEIMVFEV